MCLPWTVISLDFCQLIHSKRPNFLLILRFVFNLLKVEGVWQHGLKLIRHNNLSNAFFWQFEKTIKLSQGVPLKTDINQASLEQQVQLVPNVSIQRNTELFRNQVANEANESSKISQFLCLIMITRIFVLVCEVSKLLIILLLMVIEKEGLQLQKVTEVRL